FLILHMNDRLLGANDILLIVESLVGVLRVEEIKIRLAYQVFNFADFVCIQIRLVHGQESALSVLEKDRDRKIIKDGLKVSVIPAGCRSGIHHPLYQHGITAVIEKQRGDKLYRYFLFSVCEIFLSD